tara:strand:+ start:9846 stop:10298 length:453 start_codon:yes stop_codon:yes gene_type:complete
MLISVIDDSLVDSKLITNNLADLGYSETMVYNTVNTFINDNIPFDLLMLDVIMTPINGSDYLKLLRTTSNKPVVLTTSLESFDPLLIDCCYHTNISFIQKPITKKKLKPLLDYYLERYLALQKKIFKENTIKKLNKHIIKKLNFKTLPYY